MIIFIITIFWKRQIHPLDLPLMKVQSIQTNLSKSRQINLDKFGLIFTILLLIIYNHISI